MTTSARAHLHVTTGDTLLLIASSGFTAINLANAPALVTATAGLVEFDSPSPGQLRFIGPGTKSFDLTVALSTQAPAVDANFLYRISVNGATVAASEQIASQSSLVGFQGIALAAIVDLVAGDVLEVAVAPSGDAFLEIAEMSVTAFESLTDVAVAPTASTVASGDWPDLRAITDSVLIASALAEPATYTPLPDASVDIRVIFDLEGRELNMDSGLYVATGAPKIGLVDTDIGRAAEKDDLVSVRGKAYKVRSVTPGERGWSHCKLHEV